PGSKRSFSTRTRTVAAGCRRGLMGTRPIGGGPPLVRMNAKPCQIRTCRIFPAGVMSNTHCGQALEAGSKVVRATGVVTRELVKRERGDCIGVRSMARLRELSGDEVANLHHEGIYIFAARQQRIGTLFAGNQLPHGRILLSKL